MDPYYQYLLHQCRHPELHERLRALDTLGKDYLDLVEADFLLVLLHGTSQYEEQSAILGIMSQMGTRAPVAALIELLEQREAGDSGLREYVAATLAALKESTPLDLFIRILKDPTEEGGLREEIAELLGDFGERVPIEVHLAAVADPDPDICVAAIRALSAQGARAPLDPILAHLAHPAGRVRKAAIRALSRARERAPLEPIVAALGDPDPEVREAAAWGIDLLLEWFGTRVPLAPLLAALADDSPLVRETALDALANHPEYAPLDRVVPALDDSNAYVRCAALLVLERMGSRVPEEVYPTLLRMTQADPYPKARMYATWTLLALKGLPPGKEDWGESQDFTVE